ncbi:unnamed protein product [Arctogadus glacialis]
MEVRAVPSLVMEVRAVPSLVMEVRAVPSPVMEVRAVPSLVMEVRAVPSLVMEVRAVPSLVMEVRAVPSLVMEVRAVPSPVMEVRAVPSLVMEVRAVPSPVMEVREVRWASCRRGRACGPFVPSSGDDGRVVNRASGVDHQTAAPRVPRRPEPGRPPCMPSCRVGPTGDGGRAVKPAAVITQCLMPARRDVRHAHTVTLQAYIVSALRHGSVRGLRL